MDLREPPRPATPPVRDRRIDALLALNGLLVGAVALLWLRVDSPAHDDSGERVRAVAGKLKAAGALEQAATLYAEHLASLQGDGRDPAQANMAFSIGDMYQEAGACAPALRWYYEAEARGAGQPELGQRIVYCLERLGRVHAAQAALRGQTALPSAEMGSPPGDDPVVAKIGAREVRRSDVTRTLDDMPPELAAQLGGEAQALLRKYVADELLWQKAQKLRYEQDPDVLRQHQRLLRELAIAKLVEREVLGQLRYTESDLETYFQAHKERYIKSAAGQSKELTFAQVRAAVERDYRLAKTQEGYQAMVQSELAVEDVTLMPERMVAPPGGRPGAK